MQLCIGYITLFHFQDFIVLNEICTYIINFTMRINFDDNRFIIYFKIKRLTTLMKFHLAMKITIILLRTANIVYITCFHRFQELFIKHSILTCVALCTKIQFFNNLGTSNFITRSLNTSCSLQHAIIK